MLNVTRLGQAAFERELRAKLHSALVTRTSDRSFARPNVYTRSSQRGDTCRCFTTARRGCNPACVKIPIDPSQPFGNAKRNSVRGPNYWTVDLALTKQVALMGQSRLQLRLEAFDLFNRVNYGPPNSIRSSAAFGTITSTYDPRQMQLGVKVLW